MNAPLRTSLLFCALVLWAAGPARGSSLPPSGVDLIVIFDLSTDAPRPGPEELAVFLGSLRKEDRLGILSMGTSDTPILPLSSPADGGRISLAHQIAKTLEARNEPPDPAGAITGALNQLNKAAGDRVQAIILISLNAQFLQPADEETEKSIRQQLLLSETLVFSIVTRESEMGLLTDLPAATGGKIAVIARESSVLSHLSLIYDSTQLRAAEFRRDSPEPAGKVDYRYLDEKVDTPDEAVAADAAGTGPNQAREKNTEPVLVFLVVVLILLHLSMILLGMLLFRRLGIADRIRQSNQPGHKEVRKIQSPSFSRLTLGLSRFRNALSETDSRLTQLSLDLEDYGVETWDIEKRLMDAYVALCERIFLILEHLEMKPSSNSSDTDAWLSRRLLQLLEDSDIEAVVPAPGDPFHGKYHSHAGDRPDQSPPGTILEVTRKGYTRKTGFQGDEPFTIRPAEVIVSQGASGKEPHS